jgi:phage/plasmid-like protein (TIGR03299 family)
MTMAHDLMNLDSGGSAMFYVKEVPWHGLGEKLSNPPSAQAAIQAAQLDWEVIKAPLFYHASPEKFALFPNRYALTPGAGWPNREHPVYGIVTEKYEVLQNREAFSFFDPLVQKGHATYETAGALGEGERVWVLVKLKEDFEVHPGDAVQRYLLLVNTHNGDCAVHVMFTPVRVVCQNTLSMAQENAKEMFSVRHDGALTRGLVRVADEMMDRIQVRYEAIRKSFVRMRETEVNDERLAHYMEEVFPLPKPPADDRMNDLWKQQAQTAKWSRAACLHLYRNASSCRMAGPTVWAAYNAVTEFVDHGQRVNSRVRSPAAQLNRIWFGAGSQIKRRAYERACGSFLN